MKSISGNVTSTKAISLSKASKVLSNFVNAQTGATQAVVSYLRRASASFDELVQLHKGLKASKSDRKSRKLERESTVNEEMVNYEPKQEDNEVSERKRHKKNKKKNEDEDREGGGSVTLIEEGNRKERKKRKSGEIVDLAEQSSLKKKKRRIEGED